MQGIGNHLVAKAFLDKLQTPSCQLGENLPNTNTKYILNAGFSTALNGKLI
jgi:hypothetical protein